MQVPFSNRARTSERRNGGVSEYGDEQFLGDAYTYKRIMAPDASGTHLSIKNRDKACAIWLPLFLIFSLSMVGVTELLSAKWASGNAILRSDLEQRNDAAENHGSFESWAWAHIFALIFIGLSLAVVFFYFAIVKPFAYDKARGCAKNDMSEKAESLATTAKWYCTIASGVHFLITLYALLIMVRSFVELGDTGKRDFIGKNSNYEAVMFYYLMWGFGCLLGALGNILASILFFYNARFVVQACGGGKNKTDTKGGAPLRRNVRGPSRSYYDSGKRF